MDMTKAVFFDWYNTLARFHPPREELQEEACRAHGIEVGREALRRAYLKADDFMTRENSRLPIEKRPEEERRRFWAEYESMLLRGAGVEVSPQVALEVFSAIRRRGSDFALFDDVLPALGDLKGRGLVLGLLSNLRRDLEAPISRLGLSPYLDFALSSAEVGFEKPHSALFLEALRRAGVEPAQALHVGDQYHSDVVGARGAGIRALLLGRDGFLEDIPDCPRIRSLMEVALYL